MTDGEKTKVVADVERVKQSIEKEIDKTLKALNTLDAEMAEGIAEKTYTKLCEKMV